MSKSRRKKLANRKRRIQRRLRHRNWAPQDKPMLTASNIQYELSGRTRGLGAGGIGVMHRLARQTGLIPAIDENLQLFKVHLPYHESDHVMNVAYNALSGGTCLEDLELRRNDEVYLDALGAQRIPDPTTAGDFCRRFSEKDVGNRSQLRRPSGRFCAYSPMTSVTSSTSPTKCRRRRKRSSFWPTTAATRRT